MTTITREQALKIIEAADEVISALAGTNEDVHPGSDNMLRLWDDLNDRYAPPEVVRELARIALASLDAEPVAWTSEGDLAEVYCGETGVIGPKYIVGDVPLYRHAQPVSVDKEFIPKNLDKALGVVGVALPESKEEFNFQIERWIQRLIDRVIRYADEFKEQPAPVVPDEMATSDDMNLYQKSFAQGYNACRNAMLNAEPLHATPKGNRLRIAEGKLAEYSLSKREPQPTPESADRKMLKRLAMIMSGSDSGGEISALTVTAQSLVDRCKALALDKEKLAATESLVFEVKCPFPYGWGELKRRTNQDALFFSAYMVEGEEITELHRDIVSRTVDRLLKVIAVCQTDASFNGPTTWNPASLEEVNKRIVRESTGIPSREAIIAGGVLVQCPRCYNDSYRLNVNGLTHYWCDKCANSITSESK